MSKHLEREQTLHFVYSTLLKSDLNMAIDTDGLRQLTSAYQEVIHVILSQKEELIELINDELKEWSFDRLGYIEQAILLLACGEIIVIKTPKQVVIDESIEFAKKYGETDTTYKLINATLDKVLDV